MQMLVCWSVCLLVYIAESTSKSTWFLFPTAIHSFVYSLLSECPVTCDLGLSSVYLGLAESSFGLTLPIFPTIIFYLCFNLCLTLCFTYFTYVLTYVKLCLTYASTRHMKLTCFCMLFFSFFLYIFDFSTKNSKLQILFFKFSSSN